MDFRFSILYEKEVKANAGNSEPSETRCAGGDQPARRDQLHQQQQRLLQVAGREFFDQLTAVPQL